MSTTTHNAERMVVGEADLRRQAEEAPPAPAPAPAPRRPRRQSTPEPPPVEAAAADTPQEDES